MGRLYVGAGTRYEREGRTFLVVQVLRDGRLLVEDQSGGGEEVVTRAELTGAWDRGVLRFAVQGPGVRAGGEGALPTAYTVADFHVVPEAERAEAWRRYALIRPLLMLPAGGRTRGAIAQYLQQPPVPQHLHHQKRPPLALVARPCTHIQPAHPHRLRRRGPTSVSTS